MIRVLIVDDHPVVRAGLAGMIATDPGLEVVGEAEDGDEALRLLPTARPDVVLMDLRMPRLDGVETTRRIRAGAVPPRVLVLTTYDSDAQILAAIEAGAAGYLLKDAPREDLFAAIRSVAGGGAPLSPGVAARLLDRMRSGAAEPLTRREIDVVRLVAQGWSNGEIARDLSLSEATVKTHLLRIFSKLGVGDRTSAAMTAIERGLIDAPTDRAGR